jgi:hypothetical protein
VTCNIFTSDSEASTEDEKSCVLDSSDNKTSDVWCKTDKTPISEHFIGTIVLKYSNQ